MIEGVLFRARYLGSTQLVCDGQPTKATRMMQAEEAVSRIKVSVVVDDNKSKLMLIFNKNFKIFVCIQKQIHCLVIGKFTYNISNSFVKQNKKTFLRIIDPIIDLFIFFEFHIKFVNYCLFVFSGYVSS